jgi:hypothetical protein
MLVFYQTLDACAKNGKQDFMKKLARDSFMTKFATLLDRVNSLQEKKQKRIWGGIFKQGS